MVLTIWELRKGLKHPEKAYEGTDNYFTLKLHYGGVFTKVPGRKYINGNVAYFDFVDTYLFSVHDINEMVRDIGYLTGTPLFYQYCKPKICLDYGLMPLGNDQDVLTMTAYIPRHREMSVYIETGETTTFIYLKSPSKVIIEELDEPTQVPLVPQSQVINDGVWDPNGKDLVPFVSTQVSQLSQVINPQVESLVEVVVEGVGTEPEKGDEVNVVTQDDGGKEDETIPFVEDVVSEDVDLDIGAGDEQSLGQLVENDMFAELEDMIDHDYSMIGDIDAQFNVIQPNEDEITELHDNSEGESDESSAFVLDEGWGEGEGEYNEATGEGEGEEGEDSLDTDFFVQDSNLHFDVDVDMSEFMSAVNVDNHGILDKDVSDQVWKCIVQVAINKCESLLTPTTTQLFEVIKKEAARYIAHYNGAGKYQVGRPKKKRKRGVDEARGKTSNLSRRYVSVTCAKNGNKGHNSRTYKGQGSWSIQSFYRIGEYAKRGGCG
ncbi:hypothetical protein LXL04_003599 [Taraxacum kok-saghyz]